MTMTPTKSWAADTSFLICKNVPGIGIKVIAVILF